jgi:uncharacterized protein (UPF0332 family)
VKTDPLQALLSYRLDQARETLREAGILLANEAYRGAINRAYYAMFYALLALLATRQLGTSRHSAAIALFDREFVKTGVFPTSLSQALHLAFERRQTHDYGEIVEVDRASAEEMLSGAQLFVDAVATYLGA